MRFKKQSATRAKQPAASAAFTIARKNTYILPTRYGLLFVILLTAMLAGSINYNNNLGFLLVFLLGGMATVSIIHTHRNIVGLRILSATPRPVFAGDTAVFYLTVDPESTSRKALVFSLDKSRKTIEDASAQTQARIAVKAPAPYRGELSAGPLSVSTRYPLGLFYAWSYVVPELSCIVYPRPVHGPLEADKAAGAENAKKQEGKTLRGVDDFMGLKAYQPGDPVRHISWKAYSRGQGLFTKDFAGHKRKTVMFDYDSVPGRDAEAKLSRLCGLVISAAAQNLEYGLRLPGKKIGPGRGEQHKHGCLKALALFGKNTGKNE
ncbi:MAG: DUF58 domain-containing protein [Desulfobacterales bacterium]